MVQNRPYQGDKADLRDRIRVALASLSADFWKDASTAVCERLASEDFVRNAQTVLVYCPLKGEINIQPLAEQLLELGKVVCAPRIVHQRDGSSRLDALRVIKWESDFERGPLGAWEPKPFCEPVPPQKLDLILLPGLAFDAKGGRLGRGGGFYDRLLQVSQGKTVAVCLDEQIVPSVPADELDERVQIVVSPTRTLRV